MKYILFYAFLFSFCLIYADIFQDRSVISTFIQNPIDRKLSEEEVQKRGIDRLATEIIEKIDEIDLRKMARSSIFETSYGFRWKMINVQTGNIIIIKVTKKFKLISVRNSKKSKAITP